MTQDGSHREGHGPDNPPASSTVDPQTVRDAATLVVVDTSTADAPRVLMGRRAETMIFMPGRYVFPGGRVDPADRALAPDFRLSDAATERLTRRTGEDFDPTAAVALALAAIRETAEETGALLGRPGRFSTTAADASGFEVFARAAFLPAPEALTPFARAITPLGQTRRYDTRFFAVDAAMLAVAPSPDSLPADEFDHVAWFSHREMDAIPLASITRHVVEDLLERIRADDWTDAGVAMPFYFECNGERRRELL